MFLGEYSHNLDSKGRIAVPAKFRDELGETVYISRYLDGCLAIYSEAGWKSEMDKLMQLDRNKQAVRKYIDFRTSKAAEVTFDSQGRINIPSKLLELAKLEKECVFIGSYDMIKLFSKEAWEEYDSQLTEEEMNEIAESL